MGGTLLRDRMSQHGNSFSRPGRVNPRGGPVDLQKQLMDKINTLVTNQEAQRKDMEVMKKVLAEPASRVGMTPADFWAKSTQHGKTAILGPDGQPLPMSGQVAVPGMPGTRTLGWGHDLGALAESAKPGTAVWARKHMEKMFEPVESGGRGYLPSSAKAALAESQGSTGGYTVPPQFVSQLMMLAIEESIIRPRATIMPMTARTMLIPALDQTTGTSTMMSNLIGGVVPQWTSESATRVETEPTFRQIELTAWEASFYTVASNNLLADNAVALDSVLTMLFTAAIAWFTDYAFIQGDGVGKPLGFQKSPAAIAVTRAGGANTTTFTFADAATMLGRLYWMLRASTGICWIMSQNVVPVMLQMTIVSGGLPIWIPYSGGAQGPIAQSAGIQSAGTLLGYPVLVTEKVGKLGADGDVNLVDLSKYLIGDRMDMTIDVSPHVKFINNQMVWRVIIRLDGQPWLNNVVTLANTLTVSPFVYLH